LVSVADVAYSCIKSVDDHYLHSQYASFPSPLQYVTHCWEPVHGREHEVTLQDLLQVTSASRISGLFDRKPSSSEVAKLADRSDIGRDAFSSATACTAITQQMHAARAQRAIDLMTILPGALFAIKGSHIPEDASIGTAVAVI
jgi:hypothetical protein